MEVSLYLKRPDSKTDTAIFARISYYGLRLKYYLPEKIHPQYWNKETHLAKESKKFKEYPEFNTRLHNITSDIKSTFRTYCNDNKGIYPTPEIFKDLLDQQFKFKLPTAKHSLFSFFEEIIDLSKRGLRINNKTGKPITTGTPKVYTTVYNHLKQFAKNNKRKVDFEDIDLDFYSDYTEYLTKQVRLSLNTIGKHIQTVKLIMNEATEKGINTNLKYKSRRFVTLRENAENIYLNEKELQLIAKKDLSNNKSLERVRDLFLVGCYTGLRFSDFSILKPSQIKNGFIEITQTKTRETIVIPVHKTVETIIEKYKGELPNSISNQKTNEYIKDVAKLIPELKEKISISFTKGGMRMTKNCEKWELVTTHTARRSFATNEYKAGTPSITIMAITGHKTEKSFMKYIKVTPNEHAKILKLSWDNRAKDKKIILSA